MARVQLPPTPALRMAPALQIVMGPLPSTPSSPPILLAIPAPIPLPVGPSAQLPVHLSMRPSARLPARLIRVRIRQ